MAYSTRLTIYPRIGNIELLKNSTDNPSNREFTIPTSEITDTEASSIREMLQSFPSVRSASWMLEKATYKNKEQFRFVFTMIKTNINDEKIIMDNVKIYLDNISNPPNVASPIANQFKYKIGDAFEDLGSKKIWEIVDILGVTNQYIVENGGTRLTMNRDVIEKGFENGDFKFVFVNQPVKSKDDILYDLEQVKKGDIIKILRKKDDTIYNEVEVMSFQKSKTEWYIKVNNKGILADLYLDYWEEILKKGDFEIQIIKKTQAPKFLFQIDDTFRDTKTGNEIFIKDFEVNSMGVSSYVTVFEDSNGLRRESKIEKELFEDDVLKGDLELIQMQETQSNPTIYAVDLVLEKIVKVISLNEKLENPMYDIWNLHSKDSYLEMRKAFFVVGDVLEITIKSSNAFPPEQVLITNIDFGNDLIEVKADDYAVATMNISGLFSTYDIKIIEFYNLRELFDQPILVPKDDSATTPISPSGSILSEIEQAKKDLGQLLFMRNLLSPIDFEQKIEVTQLIDEKQKLINDLNFKGIEEKMEKDQFFDDLFEQSFTPIEHQYQDIYSNSGEEIDFFTPNGSRTQLSFELNEIIRTPQFKEWFGDWELAYIYKDADALELDCSKVLTPNFEPRVVWHGTGKQFSYFIFDRFPAAYFAVNREYSQFFADNQAEAYGEGYVIPFFLNIRNPLDLTHFETKLIGSKEFFDYLYLMTGLTMEQLDVNPIFLSGGTPNIETWMYIRNNPKMLKKIADTKIYDGIHFYETNPNITDITSPAHKTEAYITFSPDQCKIADPNRGVLLLASLKSFLLKKGGKI